MKIHHKSTSQNEETVSKKQPQTDFRTSGFSGMYRYLPLCFRKPKNTFNYFHSVNSLTNMIMKNIYSFFTSDLLNQKAISRFYRIALLAAVLCMSTNLLTAQTTVNKQLYLKTGSLLNRVAPTSGTVQSTVSLFKQAAEIGSTTTGTAGTGQGITSPMTIAHTTGTNSGRLMIVTIVYDPDNGSNSAVTSVTYGGVALTKLDEQVNTGQVMVELWYLMNPTSGAANVLINWSSPASKLQIIAGVTTLYNTDPTAPFGPVVKNSGTAGTSSLSVPSSTGDFIFDAIGNAKAALTITGGQTPLYNTNTNKLYAGSSYKAGSSGTTSVSWSFNSRPFSHIGVAIKGLSNHITFTQSPVMCSPLTVKAGEIITIVTHAAVTSGTASGATLPVTATLKHGTITVFTSNIAANSGLGTTGTTGTLTWTGTIAADYTVPSGENLSLDLSNDYSAANIRIDYDATTKPSLITVPTTTYININSFNVYNAAYSGGSTITQNSVGVTNYIRAVVSDPFGFSDITGLDLVINGGSPVAATSVATSGCTRTYEYAWTPTVAGTYSIQATAKEGTEGTVTNISTITGFEVKQPSLTVTKTKTSPASGPFYVDDDIVYNIAITNTGLSTLTLLPLQDLYSTGCLQYVSSSITPNNISGGVITWNNLGSLTSGSTINVTLTMKVIGNCDPAANTAMVEGAKDNLNYVAATQTSTVNINIDVPPDANTDSYCIQGSTVLEVLGNDTDPDVVGFLSGNAGLYTVSIVTAPAKGSVTVNGDKTVQFNPTGGTPMSEDNTVTFVYRVSEIAFPTLYSDATVTVLYSAVNSPPIAVADVASTTTELPVVISVLSNDSDPDGTMMVSQVSPGPMYGTAVINPNNTVTYTPYPGFEGTDVFTYQVCDDGCPTPVQCATATVTIQVIFAYYVCKEGTSTVSVPPVPGAEGYVWDLPAGVLITAGSGTNELTVEWTGVATGSYDVCVEPTNYCGPGAGQCVVVVINKVLLTLTPQDVFCYGDNSASIDLAVTGGIEPYTYIWTKTGDPGYSASVQDPGNLLPGTYNVTVTDKYGCVATGNTTIIQPAAALGVTGNVTNENPYSAANGAIDITVTGGTSPYTYLWSNGATTEDLTGLVGGTYKVTVTDANGCLIEKNFTVNSIGGPLTISLIVATHIKCYGESTGEINLEVIGGTGSYTYTWTRDGGGFNATTQDLTGIAAGTYHVTVNDGVNSVLGSVTVTQPAAALSASATGLNVTCYGQNNGSIIVSASGGTTPYTYLWNTGATTQNLTNVGPGSYSVTITDANLCTTTAAASITQPTAISISGAVTNASCFPAIAGTITLTVSGGTPEYTYLWSNGATTKDVSDLATGIYSVTVTDAAGCSTGKTFQVKEACLEVTKSVITDPLNNQDGSYTLTYQVNVKNTGNTNLYNIQVADNLASAFPGPATFNGVSISSSKFTVNGSFTGSAPDINLLSASQSLIPGDEGLVNITLIVTPGLYDNPYTNSANGSGYDPNGLLTSDDGTVPINFTETPLIGVAKALTSGPTINPDGSFNLSFTIKVRNFGDVPLYFVQVTDNLFTSFGEDATATILSLTSTDMAVNSAYNGTTNTNLLQGNDVMGVNEINTINLSLRITPSGLGPFENTATGTGFGPGGTIATDDSQNGIYPDPDNNGDPTDNNDPTPVSFPENPEIGAAKQLAGIPVNNNDGTYSMTYEIRVKNTGDVLLNNVQVTDNLATTFGGNTVLVTSLSSTYFTVNGLYDGTSNTNLLAGTNNLAVGAQYIILLTVKVTPGTNLGPYNNSATASAISIFNTPVSDSSQNGIDVDPENDGTGNNSNPTPVSFTETPKMGLAKAIGSVTNNNDGSYTVD